MTHNPEFWHSCQEYSIEGNYNENKWKKTVNYVIYYAINKLILLESQGLLLVCKVNLITCWEIKNSPALAFNYLSFYLTSACPLFVLVFFWAFCFCLFYILENHKVTLMRHRHNTVTWCKYRLSVTSFLICVEFLLKERDFHESFVHFIRLIKLVKEMPNALFCIYTWKSKHWE